MIQRPYAGVRPTFVTFLTCFGTTCINPNSVLSLTHTLTHARARRTLSRFFFFFIIGCYKSICSHTRSNFHHRRRHQFWSGIGLGFSPCESSLQLTTYLKKQKSTSGRVLCIGDMGLGLHFGSVLRSEINGIRLRYAHL